MLASVILILVLGIVADRLFRWLKLPGLLGMILVGILLGPSGLDLLDDAIITISSDLRMIALIVILLRAGLGLDRDTLRRVGGIAVRMSALPCLFEGAAVTLAARAILGLPWAEAGVLGFVLAAVSPAVVVPSMLALRERGLGMDKGIPVLILAASSVDDVFAITLFGVFLTLALQSGQVALFAHLAKIPLQVVGGIALGLAAGWLLSRLFARQRPSLQHPERLGLLLAAAMGTVLIGEWVQIAGLLAVMTLGLVLSERNEEIAHGMASALDAVWFFAQIALFVLIGAAVDVRVAWQAGLLGLTVIAIGLVGRGLGVALALWRSNLTLRERLFCAIAYLPKATVQAAVGGVPLAMGVGSGALILAIAVLAIIITAPLGALGISLAAPRLLHPSPSPLPDSS